MAWNSLGWDRGDHLGMEKMKRRLLNHEVNASPIKSLTADFAIRDVRKIAVVRLHENVLS